MMAEMGRRDGGIEVFVAESRMTMFSFHIYWLIFASTPFRPFRNHTFQTLGLSNDTLPDFYYYGILPKRPQRRKNHERTVLSLRYCGYIFRYLLSQLF